jgi:hypothetical protein
MTLFSQLGGSKLHDKHLTSYCTWLGHFLTWQLKLWNSRSHCNILQTLCLWSQMQRSKLKVLGTQSGCIRQSGLWKKRGYWSLFLIICWHLYCSPDNLNGYTFAYESVAFSSELAAFDQKCYVQHFWYSKPAFWSSINLGCCVV